MTKLPRTGRRIAALIGWSSVVFIAFATLAPIWDRPHVSYAGPDLERFAAFVLLAGSLTLAYPRQRPLVLVAILAMAIGLELAQTLQPTRHGKPHDALVKVLGAVVGTVAAALFTTIIGRLKRAPRI